MNRTTGILLSKNKAKLEYNGDGYIFKSYFNFENKKGICYIPESGISNDDTTIELSYTYYDLYRLVKKYVNNPKNYINKKKYKIKEIALEFFESLSWQTPETLIVDWENHDYFIY